MRNRLIALEREFVCHRSAAVIEPLAEAFAEKWAEARYKKQPTPDPMDLARNIIKHGAPILTLTPLISYLNQCKRDARNPDPDRITQAIVHGYLETGLKRRCTCGHRA